MPDISPVTNLHHAALRRTAKGQYDIEAATELLIRAFNGRFAASGKPWVEAGSSGPYIDFEAIPEHTGGLSGGEYRFLMIAASIGGGAMIRLSDTISGIDRAVVDLVLAAIAHASGSHEHSGIVENGDGTAHIVRHTTLYPWPEA